MGRRRKPSNCPRPVSTSPPSAVFLDQIDYPLAEREPEQRTTGFARGGLVRGGTVWGLNGTVWGVSGGGGPRLPDDRSGWRRSGLGGWFSPLPDDDSPL